MASTRNTRPPFADTRIVSSWTAPGRLGKRTSSTPAFPGARPRRRMRARSLNTVTSAMWASTSGALSAVLGDSTIAGHLVGVRAWPGADRQRGDDDREGTPARAQFVVFASA